MESNLIGSRKTIALSDSLRHVRQVLGHTAFDDVLKYRGSLIPKSEV